MIRPPVLGNSALQWLMRSGNKTPHG